MLTLAQEEAERSHHSYIGTEHLLLGILREGDGVGGHALRNLGIDTDRVRKTVEAAISRNERTIIQSIIPTSRVKKVIELSFEESRRMGHDYVGTEHLVLGLLIEGEGIGAHVLAELGATEPVVRAELERLLVVGNQGESGPKAGPPIYRLGERVLVHDPGPPFRLWEGRIVKSNVPSYEISIPGRLEGELVTADARWIHPVPMTYTRDCPFCVAGA